MSDVARMSAIETGSACGRGRVIIATNSLELLGNGYRKAAVVFDGPGDERARWECQAGESQDAFICRVRHELDGEGRGDEEIMVHTVEGFCQGLGAFA